MTSSRRFHPRVRAYACLGILGVAGAVAVGRPELAAVTAPALLLVAAGLARDTGCGVGVEVTLDRLRVVEGDEVTVRVRLSVDRAVERVDVALALPAGLEPVARPASASVAIPAGVPRTLEFGVRASRWGGYGVGAVTARATGAHGVTVTHARADGLTPLRVFPRDARLRSAIPPARTRAAVGSRVSRRSGDGIEHADLRPLQPGDHLRSVHARVSARRGAPWVNDRHPERNADVVLFLDTFAEAGRDLAGTLDLAVRAVAALATVHVAARDRVGVVSFGGLVRWLPPRAGPVQRARILDALLDTAILVHFATRRLDRVAAAALPPTALVVALTPLLDERSAEVLSELRGRGLDLAVVEVSPVPFAPPAPGELGELAHRLWRLERTALRRRFSSRGVPVVAWHDGQPLEPVLAEVIASRRAARTAR